MGLRGAGTYYVHHFLKMKYGELYPGSVITMLITNSALIFLILLGYTCDFFPPDILALLCVHKNVFLIKVISRFY